MESTGKNRERSLANLKPWPKGVSGNPKGKSKGAIDWKTRVKRLLAAQVGDKTAGELMFNGGIHAAMKGNAGWAKLICEILDLTGNKQEHSGKVEIVVKYVDEASRNDND